VVGAFLLGPITYGLWFPFLSNFTKDNSLLFAIIDLCVFAPAVFIPLEFLAQQYYVSRDDPVNWEKIGRWETIKAFLRFIGLNILWFGPILYIGRKYFPDWIVLIDANAGIVWAGVAVYLLESWKGKAGRSQQIRDAGDFPQRDTLPQAGDTTNTPDAGVAPEGPSLKAKAEILETSDPGMRYAAALNTLKEYNQEHLLAGWEDLDAGEQKALLAEVEQIDWKAFMAAHRAASRGEGKPVVDISRVTPFVPVIADSDPERDVAIAEGRRVLAEGASSEALRDRAAFGGIVVAGGSGRRFGETGAKGVYGPVTPLGDECFYDVLIHKVLASAKANGHGAMYPLTIMVGSETIDDTLSYVRKLPDDIRARIIIPENREWPLVESGSARAFLKSRGIIARGGAGHADAFDHILKPEAGVIGLVWSDAKGDFVGTNVVAWYRSFGVRYVQHMNVDNPLTPFGDPYIVGKHALSEDKIAARGQKRAHITHVVIEKRSSAEGLANFLRDEGNMRFSLDYRDATEEIRSACTFGGPSIAVVSLESLEGAAASYWSLDKGKECPNFADGKPGTTKADKIEASSLNTPRSSNSLDIGFRLKSKNGLDRDDIFAETKTKEQLKEALVLQSRHWKKLISRAVPGIDIPASMVVQLPWPADYMTPEELARKLSALRFSAYIAEGARVMVAPDFGSLTTFSTGEDGEDVPPRDTRAQSGDTTKKENDDALERAFREGRFKNVVDGMNLLYRMIGYYETCLADLPFETRMPEDEAQGDSWQEGLVSCRRELSAICDTIRRAPNREVFFASQNFKKLAPVIREYYGLRSGLLHVWDELEELKKNPAYRDLDIERIITDVREGKVLLGDELVYIIGEKNDPTGVRIERTIADSYALKYATRRDADDVPQRDMRQGAKEAVEPQAQGPASALPAARLYKLVEEALVSRRDEFIAAGNTFIDGTLKSEMATAKIRLMIDNAIAAAGDPERDDIPPKVQAAIDSLKKGFVQFEADGGVNSLIALIRKARDSKKEGKEEGQKLIIGLETDWIPGIDKESSLQKNAISALIAKIKRSMGTDVEIVHESAAELAGKLMKKKEDISTDMRNIVVLASEATIRSDSFRDFREAPKEDRPFLTAINPEKLNALYADYKESSLYQLHIKLTTFLYMTLEAAAGKLPPETPWIKYDDSTGILLLIPDAEAMDCDMLKKIYDADIKALQSA